ncbi:MAG: M20 family metallopeptidase [Chloroflexota bacterium]
MLSALERQVLQYVDDDEVVEWTRELVRIPSVYRPETGEAEEEAARWVKARLEEIGLETSWEVVEPGRPNVIGILTGPEGGRCLMFEGHTDVVTEGDANAWKHPPYEAQMENGRIYGRGANDMKGGLVAAISAVKAIKRSGVKLGGSILVGALVDEEGRMAGVKHFVESGWASRVSAAIICEPEDNRLCIAQKGVMWTRVTVNGRMAHGAMPLTGVNPIYHAARFLTEVRALEAEEIRRCGRDPLLGQPSITPTIMRSPVRGEPQNNVMPAQSVIVLDIRLLPQQSPQDLESKLRAILGRLETEDSSFSAELEVVESRPPTSTPKDHPIVVELDRAYRELTGKDPVYGGVPGSTDGTILFSQAGVPVVTCGPGDTLIPHHVDEYLDVDQLMEATRLYVVTALRYLGASSD